MMSQKYGAIQNVHHSGKRQGEVEVVVNGATLDRFEARTKNPKKQNLKMLDFEFCPRFNSVPGSFHFSLR